MPPTVVLVAAGVDEVLVLDVLAAVGPLVLSILAIGVGVSDATAPKRLLKLVALAGGVKVKLLLKTANRLLASFLSSASVVYVVVV